MKTIPDNQGKQCFLGGLDYSLTGMLFVLQPPPRPCWISIPMTWACLVKGLHGLLSQHFSNVRLKMLRTQEQRALPWMWNPPFMRTFSPYCPFGCLSYAMPHNIQATSLAPISPHCTSAFTSERMSQPRSNWLLQHHRTRWQPSSLGQEYLQRSV